MKRIVLKTAAALTLTSAAAQAQTTFVTNHPSPGRDSVSLCSDASGVWQCSQLDLSHVPGIELRGDFKPSAFHAVDADGDGQVGFVSFKEEMWHCEPDASGAWQCDAIGVNNNRRAVTRIVDHDVDGDGILDVTFAHNGAGPQVCYGGTVPMTCGPVPGLPTGARFGSLTWGDFDHDGITDAFLGYHQPWATGYSKMCFGLAGGGYSCSDFTASPTSYLSTVTDAAAIDADLDGDLDLVVESNHIYGGGAGELCTNDGAGNFTCAAFDLPDLHYNGSYWGEGSHHMELADLDGDGDTDIALGSRGAAYACYAGPAGLSCQYLDPSVTWTPLGGGAPAALTVRPVELDGDGLVDLLVGNTDGADACYNLGNRAFDCQPASPAQQAGGIAVLQNGPVESLVEGAIASASGSAGTPADFGGHPMRAVDGSGYDPSTEAHQSGTWAHSWVSDNQGRSTGLTAWFAVDLGCSRDLTRTRIYNGNEPEHGLLPLRRVVQGDIYVSNVADPGPVPQDNQSSADWTLVAADAPFTQASGRDDYGADPSYAMPDEFDLTGLQARHVALKVDSQGGRDQWSQYYVQIAEFQVFAAGWGGCAQ